MPLEFLVYKLAEHLPLEQGLRHFYSILLSIDLHLAEHLPLEQGLRHIQDSICNRVCISQSIFH